MRRSNFARKSVVRKRVPSFQASLNEASMRWLFEDDSSSSGEVLPVGNFPDVNQRLPAGKISADVEQIKRKINDVINNYAQNAQNWTPNLPIAKNEDHDYDATVETFREKGIDGEWKEKAKLNVTDEFKKKILDLFTYHSRQARSDYFYKNYEDLANEIINQLKNYKSSFPDENIFLFDADGSLKKEDRGGDKFAVYSQQNFELKTFSDDAIKDFDGILYYLEQDWIKEKEDTGIDTLNEKAKQMLGGRQTFARQFIGILRAQGFLGLAGALQRGLYSQVNSLVRKAQTLDLENDKGLQQFKDNLASIDGIFTIVLCLSNLFSEIYDKNKNEFEDPENSRQIVSDFVTGTDLFTLINKNFMMDKNQASKLSNMYLNFYTTNFWESFTLSSNNLLNESGLFSKISQRISNAFNNRNASSIITSTKNLFDNKDLKTLLKADFSKVKISNFANVVKKLENISAGLLNKSSNIAKITAGAISSSSAGGGGGSPGGGGGASGSTGVAASAAGGAAGGAGGGAGGGGGSPGGGGAAGGAGGGAGSTKSLATILGIDASISRKVLDNLKNNTTINVSGDGIDGLSGDQKQELANALAEPEQDLRTSLGRTFTESKQRNSGVIVERWQQLAGLIKQ